MRAVRGVDDPSRLLISSVGPEGSHPSVSCTLSMVLTATAQSPRPRLRVGSALSTPATVDHKCLLSI